MKVIYMGTGEIAIPAFQAILESGHECLGLITQPDKPVGRKQVLTPPEIKTVALNSGIPVWQPEKVREKDFLTQLEELQPEVIVVFAYGQILPQRLINIPSCAIINVHASLLPLYRGASCIQAPILNGDEYSGATVMHVVKALDAGDIIDVWKTKLSGEETGGSLHDRTAEAAPELLLRALEKLQNGTVTRLAQDEEKTCYAPKLLRQDGKLDFKKQSALEIERMIRAYDPWPGTFANYLNSKGRESRMKLFPLTEVDTQTNGQPGTVAEVGESHLAINCASGVIKLFTVQPEGKRRMNISEFLRGHEVEIGEYFFL